jgi:hypothetical protein
MNYIQENFANWIPRVYHYNGNNRIAIQYESESTEIPGYMEPECMATINVPDEHLELDDIIIKDYSENEGIYQCMVDAGHIAPAHKYVNSGFITAPVCKLLLLH